jgi:hypothetical protein
MACIAQVAGSDPPARREANKDKQKTHTENYDLYPRFPQLHITYVNT